MSVIYCPICDESIDTDFDAEHFADRHENDPDCPHPQEWREIEDNSIGSYEYFGAKGYHKQINEVCTLCNQVIEPEEPDYEPSDE